MQGKGNMELPASIEQSWIALMDPEVLKKCITGCKEMNLVDENKYKAEIIMGVAAVKGRYTTTIGLSNMEKPTNYRLTISGVGGPGSINAVADITLEKIDGNQHTMLSYTYEAEVGGKVAMVGQRMLGGVSKLIINGFFKKISNELKNK